MKYKGIELKDIAERWRNKWLELADKFKEGT